MRRVVWTPAAVADVDRIYAYVAFDNPGAAQRLVGRLIILAQSLGTASARGRPISLGRRELTIVRPYLLRYRIEDDTVRILEVRHGARRPEDY